MSSRCVFKVATCCFCSAWSPVPVRGLWYCCLMSRGSPHTLSSLVCCCVSAVVVLTRGDMQPCVPRLIAATWLIVFLCSTLIDSLDSRGIPTGTQRQTNLGVQSITDARVTAQRSRWLRFSESVCVCMCEYALCKRVIVWRCLPTPSELTGIFSQSLSACLCDFD